MVESKQGLWSKQLVHKMTCPNCWHSFHPDEVCFVAKHPDLVGDPIAGSEAYLRFEPTRFNIKGEAIDPKGFPTSQLACPKCHLQVPETMLEVGPLFISVIGAPASGKSYFLTTMTWQLRTLMPQAMISFSDADPVANEPLHEYEQTLFLNPRPDQPTEIRKTQTDDPRLYRTSLVNDTAVRYPVPLQFSLWPLPEHPGFSGPSRIGRIVVLYDNAGEDFLPGAEVGSSAVVQHLARSHIYFAFFDPTQDPRFRAECHSEDPQLSYGLRPGGEGPTVLLRQETLLKEAAVRIRRYLGLSADKRLRKPLIVVVPKSDIWQDMLETPLDGEPYAHATAHSPLGVCIDRIEQVSDEIRRLFLRLCPEFVATAEGLSEVVRYVPVSSLGCSPELVESGEHSFYGVRPKDVSPKWVAAPLMYALCKWATGILQTAPTPASERKGEQ